MTAEIAILNKNAVALAADSAVTLRNPANQKVYNTANKLFMLSKYHPVGVMVYGPAELIGVPWETAIKMFRAELHTTNFDRLIQFAERFINFLECNRLLYPAALQESEFALMCQWVLSQIKEKINSRVQAEIAARGVIDGAGVERIIAEMTDEEFRSWQQYRRLDCFPIDFEPELLATYAQCLNRVLDEVFVDLPIRHVREQLLQICAFRATKDWWSLKSGGIVVAGFGKNEFLPVLHSYTVESILNNRLKHDRIANQSNDMGESQGAAIIPFAQAEIVYRFIRGIDPEYKRELASLLRHLLTTEYPEKIVTDFAERTTEEERRNVQAELIRIGRSIMEGFEDRWSDWEHGKFVGPVLDIVGDLPKDDLAAMAESLAGC